MNYILISGLVILLLAVVMVFRLGWELLQQNGRMLLRMEALEKHIKEKAERGKLESGKEETESGGQKAEVDQTDQSLLTSAPTENEQGRANRFSNHSLANSKIKRDGLKAGTMAPEFRLPRLEGGELSLSELRGRVVLLVFSSPHCGPCNALAPRLEKFHRKHPELEMVIISKGEADENRDRVEEHGLTFPVVLQKQWEVSREYAMFATPVAYLIDSAGVITADVAVGVDSVLDLMTPAARLLRQSAKAARPPLLKRLARWPVRILAGLLQWLVARLTTAKSKIDTFQLMHFKFVPRPDDIFIVTYPRSGTTWMQMILYQLTTDGSMDFAHISDQCPWFEHAPGSDDGFEKRRAPRLFKSHLSYRSIPKGPGRYIYVVRDGRDVAISYYNLYRTHNGYKGSFAEFFELFMRGKAVYGSWFKHVEGWWKHRNELNVLFLTYEELTRDLEGCLRRIIGFCHLEVTPEKLPLIVQRCSFAFMKQHESKFDPALETLSQHGVKLNSFIRTGRTGEGVRELTPEQQVRFDEAFRVLSEPNGFARPTPAPPIEAAAPNRNVYAVS